MDTDASWHLPNTLEECWSDLAEIEGALTEDERTDCQAYSRGERSMSIELTWLITVAAFALAFAFGDHFSARGPHD